MSSVKIKILCICFHAVNFILECRSRHFEHLRCFLKTLISLLLTAVTVFAIFILSHILPFAPSIYNAEFSHHETDVTKFCTSPHRPWTI